MNKNIHQQNIEHVVKSFKGLISLKIHSETTEILESKPNFLF